MKTCSTAATEHLRECAACREFHEQQTKLRQIVGSLGTVDAPADFDFRLRARLAADADKPALSVSGHLRAGVWQRQRCCVVFGVGAVVIWQRYADRPADSGRNDQPTATRPDRTQTIEPSRREEGNRAAGSLTQGVNVAGGACGQHTCDANDRSPTRAETEATDRRSGFQ